MRPIARLLLRGGGIVLACGAAGAVAGLGRAELPPVPTVPTVPTVPIVTTVTTVTTVPVPLPPAPTVPALPAPTLPAPPPATPVPLPPLDTAPVTTTAPLPSAPGLPSGSGGAVTGVAPGSAGSSSGASEASSTGAEGASPPTAAADRRAGVTVRVGPRPGSVLLVFPLRAAGRVLVTARGPLPGCDVVARERLRGRKGENVVTFTGELAGRRLAPGVYVLTLRHARSSQERRAVVRATERGALRVDADTRAAALAACEAPSAVSAFADGSPRAEPPAGGTAGMPEPLPPAAGEPEAPFEDVRAFAGVELLAETVSPVLVAIGAILLMVALASSLAGMAAFVRRRRDAA